MSKPSSETEAKDVGKPKTESAPVDRFVIRIMKKCPMCKGSGKGQPTSSGMESSWRINQYLMSQPCGYCKGKGEVANKDKPTPEQTRLYTGITDGSR